MMRDGEYVPALIVIMRFAHLHTAHVHARHSGLLLDSNLALKKQSSNKLLPTTLHYQPPNVQVNINAQSS